MTLKLEQIDLGSFGVKKQAEESPIEAVMEPEVTGQVRSNVNEAFKINPDEHAKANQLSKESNVPVDAVKSNPAEVESKLKLDNINFDEMSKRNPNTAKYLTDFNNSVIAQDDIDVLQEIEDVVGSVKSFFSGVEKGVRATPELVEQTGKAVKVSGLIGVQRQLEGLQADEDTLRREKRRLELMKRFGVKEPRSIFFNKAIQDYDMTKTEEFQSALQEYRETAEKIRQQRPEDFAGQFGFDAVQMIEKMVPVIAASALTGGSSTGLFVMFNQVYMDRQAQLVAEGMEINEARSHAFASATIETATEKIPLDILVGKFGWTGIKKFLGYTVAESLQEGASSALQSAWDKATINPDMTLKEALNELGYEMLLGATGATVIGGVYTGVEKTIDVLTKSEETKQTQGEVEQQKIDQLNETSQKSKLRERDKESFKQFVKDVDGENNTHVFVDSAQASLYLQEKTTDEIDADPALKMLSEKVKEAAETGEDVQIPVADFAADFAGTEHFDALRDSMTMSDEAIAPFRQEQVQQETETYIQGLMQQAEKNVSEYSQAQDIYTQVREQLIDSGTVTPANASIMSQIVPAWATAKAVREGKSVEQVYRDAGLTIEGPQTGEAARLQGEVFEQGETYTPENPVYPMAPRSEWYGDADFAQRGGQVVMMNPQEYLDSVSPLKDDELTLENIQDLQTHIEEGHQLDPLVIYETGKEDGRHRARAAINLGIDKVPVILFGKQIERFPDVETVAQDATLLEQSKVTEDETTKQKPGSTETTETATQQEIISRAKARNDAEALAEFNRAAAGETVTFVHRSFDDFTQFDDTLLGTNTSTPSGNLGHYLSAADVSNVERYGPELTVHQFTLQNPLMISAEAFEASTHDLTPEQATQKREQLIELGHDGILIEDLNWAVVFESKSLEKLEEQFEDVDSFFKQEPIEEEKDLYITHNLSIDNLLHANKMGGIPVPSLAIARTGTGFEGFGEISLIADTGILSDPYAKTFGADIYSPRYPSVSYKIDWKQYRKIIDPIDEHLQEIGLSQLRADLESRGVQELYYDSSARYLFLESQGKAPKLTYKKKESIPKYLRKFKGGQWDIAQKEEFKEAAKQYYREKAEEMATEITEGGKAGKEYSFWLDDWMNTYFNEQGEVYLRYIDELAYTVAQYHKPRQVDSYEVDRKISKKLESVKAQQEFKDWLDETFSPVIEGERIFQGFTPTGNRRYIAHTLDNVVKIMKKQLRGGENFNYGVGTIRSAIAPQFKTIKRIQAAKGKIVAKDVMEQLKEETNDRFMEVVEELRPYYKYDQSGFGFLDAAAENLFDMARGKGLPDFENVPADVRTTAAEFLAQLRDMPTEYFETKIQRSVELSEFDTAVVPKDTPKKVTDILKSQGLKVKTYDSKVEGARAEVIGKQKQLLFQRKSEDRKQARGYYDPSNSIIRLTEAADLSTFLHEFAHFMYEMEVNGNTELLQSINNWYKRNAEDVAKEANSYLGEQYDALKQGVIEPVPTETEAFKKWFKDSKVVDENGEPLVVYHGSKQAGFHIFDTTGAGKTEGTGAFFTESELGASTYSNRRGEFIPVTAEEVSKNPDEYGIEIIENEDGTIDAISPAGFTYTGDTVLEALKEMEEQDGLQEEQSGNYAVYLSLQNPKIIDAEGANWDSIYAQKYFIIKNEEGEQVEAFTNEADADFYISDEDNQSIHGEMTIEEDIDTFDAWSTDDLIKEAREEGYDGVIINNVTDEGPHGQGYGWDNNIYVAFEPEQIKSTYNRGTFDPTNPNILEQEQQPPEGMEGSITEDDVIAFLDNETSGDVIKDKAIRRAVHEQFARGFEQYLLEGKAPSIELRNAFRTFARWLAQLYQAIRGALNVNLDNEMRQVFDRMLATEEQIAAAEARAQFEPMFTDAAMAGMTDEEFAAYQKRQEKVKDVQTETLRDKIIKQLTRQTQKWWNEEKQDLIDEETETLSKQQVYVARARLKDGDMKLDHATVKEMIGEEKTDKRGRTFTVIPPKLRGMTAKGQQGVHPDEAAAFFGYRSGSEMLDDLVKAPSLKEAAETAAEARMVEIHGDIMTDGTIEKEADEAVRNEERGRLILAELRALAKGTTVPRTDRATIRDLAYKNIGKLSFREIFPGKYRKAEIRAAQESARMLAEGNKEGAAAAKMRQVMNFYLGMAATQAKNETMKIVDRMNRYNKKKVREEIQKAENGYWDQIVKILNRFEFRKTATLKEVESINTWMKERMESDGDGLVLTNTVLNESYVTHWKNVPYSDLQGINDSVKNIEHVARYANKLTRMQEEIDFNKLVDRWVTSMNEKVETQFVTKRTDVVEGRKWGNWFMAQMTKIPVLASWLDGGERAGLSHQVLVQPFTEAYNQEIKLWEKSGTPVMEAIENRSKADIKRHNQKVYIPEINDHLYVHQIIAVALNTGNHSNLKKMLLGEKWANPEVEEEISFDNPKLQAVLDHLTESDWKLVQLIWDQMEILYPQLAEVHRRTTGLTPPKVESTPVETKYGTFRGGYYPVKYDANRDFRAELNEDKLNAETESMFSNGASIQASVNAGATNERTGYYAPIRLSLDVVPAHFQETIHYITHHDPVREVNRLIRNKQVAQTIKAKLGPEEYAQLKPWLNDIAKDGREAPTKTFIDSMLQRLRFGVTLGVMGFKASTGIIQVSGLSNSIAEVGNANMLQAMRSILGSVTTMKQAWEFAVEHSEVMEHRTQTMDREIKNAMKRLEGKRGFMAAVQEASMKHIALIQTYMVDLPSWHAAYIKGMKEWGDEARAFQYADWVIENVQGSGVTKDMARIMRNQGEAIRMFTMFMTFFSSLWNMQRDMVKGAKTGRYSPTNVAAKSMFLFVIPVLFEMMMRGELAEPDDDEDTRLQRMLTNTAMFPLQTVPFVRDIASASLGDYGYNITPLQMVLEQGTKTIPEIVKRGFTDEEITKGQVKGATKFVGAVVGIPGMNQMWATGEHLYEVMEEGEDLTMHQLMFGPNRN